MFADAESVIADFEAGVARTLEDLVEQFDALTQSVSETALG